RVAGAGEAAVRGGAAQGAERIRAAPRRGRLRVVVGLEVARHAPLGAAAVVDALRRADAPLDRRPAGVAVEGLQEEGVMTGDADARQRAIDRGRRADRHADLRPDAVAVRIVEVGVDDAGDRGADRVDAVVEPRTVAGGAAVDE